MFNLNAIPGLGRRVVVVAVFLVVCNSRARAAVDFVRDVQPIFKKHCYSCHGAEKQKSGLRLDVKAAALHGGTEYAPNIIPGKSKESTLIKYVLGQMEESLMPPKDDKLTPTEIGLLRQWIDEGAVWPDGVDKAPPVEKRDR